MHLLLKYNSFRSALVVKYTVDGGVKVRDNGDELLEITKFEFPSLVIDLLHTNHAYAESHGIQKFKLKFDGLDNLDGILPIIHPGDSIVEIISKNGDYELSNTRGISGKTKCCQIAVKAMA